MAKDDQEEAFEKLLAADLQRVMEFLKYAEAKNGALVTLSSAWTLAIIGLLATEKPIAVAYRTPLKQCLVFIVLAGLCSLISFYPRMRLPRFLGGRRAGPHPPNLLYFGDLKKLTPKEVEQQLRDRYFPEEGHAATQPYLHDLSVQIAVNSQIVCRKMQLFTAAVILVGLAVLVPLILHYCPYLSAKVSQWL